MVPIQIRERARKVTGMSSGKVRTLAGRLSRLLHQGDIQEAKKAVQNYNRYASQRGIVRHPLTGYIAL